MNKRGLVWTLSAAWLALFIAGFVAFQLTEPTGDSFTRGMNRMGAFLGYQATAALVALVSWAVLGSLPEPLNGWRRAVAMTPPVVSGALFLALILLFVAAILFR